MKKFMSLVLALVMVCSMSVTVFAAGEQTGTTTLTANIPNAAEPSYTIRIPANMTLEYGNTGPQHIGYADAKYDTIENCDKITVVSPYTMLINTDDSSDTLDWCLLVGPKEETLAPVDPSSGLRNDGIEVIVYENPYVRNSGNYWAQVSDWSGATPGATYQAVITFRFTAK